MLKKYHNLYVLVLLLLCIDFSSLGLYLQTHPSTGNQPQPSLTVVPAKNQHTSSNSVSSSSNIYSSSQQTKPTQSGTQFSPSPTHPTTSSNSGTNNMLSSSGSSIATASSNILGGNYSWAYLSFSFRKLITINHTIVSGGSTLTNFPVLIDLYDADLHTKVQASGNDIIFTDTSGNKLSFEIQTFNQNYNSTHAHLVAWVNIPSLSDTVDTKIFMYYGNPTIGSQQTPANVCDSNYKAVYHFETDPSQTNPESTSNQYNATSSNSMTTANLVPGYIGNGYNFVSSSSDKVISTSTSVGMGTSSFTFSTWFYEQSTATYRPLIGLYSSTNSYTLFYLGSGSVPSFHNYNSGTRNINLNYFSNSTGHWYYIVVTYSSGTVKLYINGSLQTTTSLTYSIPQVTG